MYFRTDNNQFWYPEFGNMEDTGKQSREIVTQKLAY